MAQRRLRTPAVDYNSCTSTFIKENLFLTFKCKWVYKYFVAVDSKISILKKLKVANKIWAISQAVLGQGAKFWW